MMLYTYSIGNQLYNRMVLFKMRDSVPGVRYSDVCNVLRLWRIWFIPTYRVYRLYDTLLALINRSIQYIFNTLLWWPILCAVFRVGFHLFTCNHPFLWLQVYLGLCIIWFKCLKFYLYIKLREATITLL